LTELICRGIVILGLLSVCRIAQTEEGGKGQRQEAKPTLHGVPPEEALWCIPTEIKSNRQIGDFWAGRAELFDVCTEAGRIVCIGETLPNFWLFPKLWPIVALRQRVSCSPILRPEETMTGSWMQRRLGTVMAAAVRLTVLLLPSAILLAASLRETGPNKLTLWLGTAFQVAVCFLSTLSRGNWRQPLGPSLITLYLTSLAWLWF